MEPRRQIPDPTYHWPGGPTADDDPTPIESALAALKIGAILAAAITIAFIYLGDLCGHRRRAHWSDADRAGRVPAAEPDRRLAGPPGCGGAAGDRPLTLRYTYRLYKQRGIAVQGRFQMRKWRNWQTRRI